MLLARMDAEDFAHSIGVGQAAEHFSSPSSITDCSDSAGWISEHCRRRQHSPSTWYTFLEHDLNSKMFRRYITPC